MQPRQNSLVRLKGHQQNYPGILNLSWAYDGSSSDALKNENLRDFIFIGAIPNLEGQCVLLDIENNQMRLDGFTDDFMEVDPREL